MSAWWEDSGSLSPRGVWVKRVDDAVAVSPVTLAQCKTHLKTDAGDVSEDALIGGCNAAACELVEAHTQRSLKVASFIQAMDRLPGGGALELRRWPDRVPGGCGLIELRRNPVAAVASIGYRDDADFDQVVPVETYRLEKDLVPGRLFLKTNQQWPDMAPEPGRVKITFSAGYPDNKCPAVAISAILLLVGHFYEHREASAPGPDYDNLWKGLRRLLTPIWIPAF